MSTTRKVTIVSTKNNQVKFYETDAKTWGELNALINRDFDLSNQKATENINKTTLEHIDAVLPEGEFRVFLRPVKTKSGAQDFDNMKFGDLRATFKDDENVKKFLTGKVSDTGRNWTQLKTDELRAFLKEYHSSAVSNVVESLANAKVEEGVAEEILTVQGTIADSVELNTLEKFETAIALLQEVADEIDNDGIDEDEEVIYLIQEFIDDHSDDITRFLKNHYSSNTTKAPKQKKAVQAVEEVETEEQKAAREEKEREQREIADALAEAKDFSSGFTN